jgi:hypothetical protein
MEPINLYRYIYIAFVFGIIFIIVKAIAQKFDSRPNPAVGKTAMDIATMRPTEDDNEKKSTKGPKNVPRQAAKSIEQKANKPSWLTRVWPGPKLIVEASQYLATICGAFVGLCVTFMVNSEKSERDKKNHLINVLAKYELANLEYHRWIGEIAMIRKTNLKDSANMIFWKGVKDHPYPYFENFKDATIFDVTPLTAEGMQFHDYQVKVLFDSDLTRQVLISINQIDLHLKYSYDHVALEMKYLTNEIDSTEFLDKSRHILDTFRVTWHAL